MPQKEYPPFFEKAIPAALILIALLIIVVLVITLLVAIKVL